MLLRASTRLRFTVPAPVPMVLMLRPRSGDGQWVTADAYDVTPVTPITEYTDTYGNLCQRLTAPAGDFSVQTTCEVTVPDDIDRAPGLAASPLEAVPDAVLQFLLPSRYCESDKLFDAAWEIAGDCPPGYDQAERVRSWMHANIAYVPGSTTSSTSACDTYAQREGVCRDLAHLGIALSRALDLPARMVVGYLHDLKPMDLHAWYECYIGDRWWTFDAKEPVSAGGRIVIAHGRDAADVALVTQFGPADLLEMQVTVERTD